VKRFLFTVEIIILALLLPMMSYAQNSSHIYLNGDKLTEQWVPMVMNSNTYVPLSLITGQFQIRGSILLADNQHYFKLSDSGIQTKLQMSNGIYYVKASFLSEQLGLKITRDMLTGSVYLFDRAVTADISSQLMAKEESYNPIVSGLTKKEPVHIDLINPALSAKLAVVDTIISNGESIIIHADREVKANVFYIRNPERIVMDFPYSRFADQVNGNVAEQNGEIATDHPWISKIRYAMFTDEPSTLRVVIDLKQKANYTVSTDEQGETILSIPFRTYKVAIDAGHGGRDPGSPGASKKDEKFYTLSLAEKVYHLLKVESGITPMMIRTDDSYISPQDRAAIANQEEADVFISLHANSYTNKSTRGTETYYHNRNSMTLASILHEQVVNTTGFPDRNVRKMNYIVIKETIMPAALLEIGYISNPEEESIMISEGMQNEVAMAIVRGIKQYIQLEK
jgi:N-acetylmuramoyl-L-alanine amidase